MRHLTSRKYLTRLMPAVVVALLVSSGRYRSAAEDDADPGQKPEPIGRVVTIEGEVGIAVERAVIEAAEELQKQAVNEGREAVLVLELHRGPGRFGLVSDLAWRLTSGEFPKVRTVAWIPKGVRLDGNKAILALACKDVVMHPDAELGDIGEGRPAEKRVRDFVLDLAQRRHNPRLSPALAHGMADPQTIVHKVEIQSDPENDAAKETRLVTDTEYKTLLDEKKVVEIQHTFKDAGVVGIFAGSKYNDDDVLVVRTAQSLDELAAIYGLPARSLRDSQPSDDELKVALIKIDGMIEPVLESFLERQIDRSLERGVTLLIFEIDSPGGYLQSSENLAFRIAELEERGVKTVAYIPNQAISGAAIIALGCDEIYMHPDAQIGDAGPIQMGEGGQFEHVPEKILSKLKATLRSLADKKDRPRALLEAMADKDLVVYRVTHRDNPRRVWYMTEEEIAAENGVWQQAGKIAQSQEGDLLTLTGKEAHQLELAEKPVEGRDGLKSALGIPAEMKLVALGRTWVDTFIFLLNTRTAMFLLLVVGIIALYLELHMMTGLLGIIAAVCFSLFFWSRFLGGTAGWLEIILFLLGLGCIALEIFVMPGFGVFGVSGGLLLLASLVLASQTFGNMEPNEDYRRLTETMGTLALSILAVLVLAMALSRYLPQMPLFRHLVLAPPGVGDDAAMLEPRLRPEYVDPALSLIGRQGTAVSVLRPAGKAEFGERIVDVVSEGPYIAKGTPVEVVEVTGNRVVVRGLDE